MKLESYIKALVNLNGMVHEDRVMHVYNLHHPNNPITTIENIDLKSLNKAFIEYIKGWYVHEAISYDYSYEEKLHKINGKPYYIPSVEDIENYQDEDHLPLNEAYFELYNKLEELGIDNNTIDDVMFEIQGGAQHGFTYDLHKDTLSWFFKTLTAKEEQSLKKYIMAYNQTIKRWDFNGFSPNELKAYDALKSSTGRNDLCPCGSGKKYKKCCINKTAIDFNYGPLEFPNSFTATEEERISFRNKLKPYKDKILWYISMYDEPSFNDLIDDMIDFGTELYSDYRPKDIIAALATIFLEIHQVKGKTEEVYRKLGVWGKRKEILVLKREIETEVLMEQIVRLTDEEIKREFHLLTIKHKHDIIDIMPKNRPFKFLHSLQRKTTYDESLFQEIEQLAYQTYISTINEKFMLLYNLLYICPYAYGLINLFIEVSDESNQLDISKAIINAFEMVQKKMLKNPPADFYKENDYRIYIIALDTAAYYSKINGNHKVAITYYQKEIKYDDSHRLEPYESILVCYLVTNQMDQYYKALSKLKPDSIYKIMLDLYHRLVAGEAFHHAYLKAIENYKLIIDILLKDVSLDQIELSLMERFFIEDFYILISEDKQAMDLLREIHHQ